MNSEFAIEMRGITKRFPGIVANDNITLQLRRGEIHALLGENGAGKSTLMSILFGLYQPDEGAIFKDGRQVKIGGPNDANALGIGMVHQHFKLVECFSVLENIILGAETVRNGMLDRRSAEKRVAELSEKYGLSVDPDALIKDITVGMQQRTEILKMLYRENDILIFDEPTAVLTPNETDELIKIMKALAKEGCSILFITHKLAEIKAAADRCTVLRRGKYIGTVDVKDVSKEELSRMMVGRDVALELKKKECRPGGEVLRVEGMTVSSATHGHNAVNNVSFSVRKGEIVCIAGIDGNGQTELVYGLSGLLPLSAGHIFLDGRDISRCSVRKRSLAGLSHIPEDRHKHGLILDYTLESNLVLQTYFGSRFNRAGFIRKKAVREYAERLIETFDIRSANGPATVTRNMSGGNQQKAIIARETDKDPKLLIAVQPTRGLDVGAIEYIHRQLTDLRDKGHGVLLVSLELEEVLSVSDRILVMYEGSIVGEFDAASATREKLGLYMAGAEKEGSE